MCIGSAGSEFQTVIILYNLPRLLAANISPVRRNVHKDVFSTAGSRSASPEFRSYDLA